MEVAAIQGEAFTMYDVGSEWRGQENRYLNRLLEYKRRRQICFWGCCGLCRSKNIRLPLKRGGEYVKRLFLRKVRAFMRC
jgi:hypothetical protein